MLAAGIEVNRKRPELPILPRVTEPRHAGTSRAGKMARKAARATTAVVPAATRSRGGGRAGTTPTARSFSMAGTRSPRRSPIRRAASARFWRPKTRCGGSPMKASCCRSNLNWCGRTPLPRGFRPTRCIKAFLPKPIHYPRRNWPTWPPPALSWCSTRSPTRTMSARSCAPRRLSRSPPSSSPRATARKRPACLPNPHPARSNWCRS